MITYIIPIAQNIWILINSFSTHFLRSLLVTFIHSICQSLILSMLERTGATRQKDNEMVTVLLSFIKSIKRYALFYLVIWIILTFIIIFIIFVAFLSNIHEHTNVFLYDMIKKQQAMYIISFLNLTLISWENKGKNIL